jgi:hypothetical protein
LPDDGQRQAQVAWALHHGLSVIES